MGVSYTRMNWTRILIDIPVRLFDLWWFVYRIVLTVLFMVVGTVTLIALALAALGIRWGW